ncbi:MAG: hypothetical protein IPI67_34070 [Myxococcales bacterium]|nr:hypothetical protein [Myxococcales bacterium]
MQRVPRRQLSASATSLLLFALAMGCSPVASFRPASGLMSDRRTELGLGMAQVTPRPYVTEPSASASQAWISGAAGRRFDVTGIYAFDDDAVAAGGALRFTPLRFDRLAAGVEQELGYAWFGLSTPMALRLVDETWLYTAPRLGTWGFDLAFFIPVGLSVRVVDGLMLRAEWQRSWQDFKYYNRRDHYGLAIAHQFP